MSLDSITDFSGHVKPFFAKIFIPAKIVKKFDKSGILF
jgi:hypothetical protein